MTGTADLEREAARLRDGQVFGRSGPLLQLFDMLVAASKQPRAVKEIDIATTVFGKPEALDLSQDATVRVYVHRLRRKLDAFYATDDGAMRLDIPRGNYDLALVAREAPRPVPARKRAPRWPWFAGAAVALNLLVWSLLWPQRPVDETDIIRRSPPWAAILADDRPLTIVLGDYYIFGEVDARRGVDRMVREYGINSRADLDQYLMAHPDRIGSYQDLDLSYLPAGSAFALRSLLPVLLRTDAERARTRIVLSSQLTPGMLQKTNVVYVGYFSAMGPMVRNPVFSGSRLAVGTSWDELIDTKTGRHFRSEQGGPDQPGIAGRDYGYVSTFATPTGNHFVIVAGTRDVALMQAADAATSAASLAEQQKDAKGAPSYEALYEVEGVNRFNMGAKLLLVSPLTDARIWRQVTPTFPAE